MQGASIIDSGLASSTRYYYRLSSGNLAGDSGYSVVTPATTAAGGTDIPLDPSVLKLWLKADTGTPVDENGALSTWLDVSGNTNTLALLGDNAIWRPYWVSSENLSLGHPVLRFFGSNYFNILFTSSPANWTSGEAFLVVRGRTNAPTGNAGPGHWRLGPNGGTYYPRASDKNIADDFGSSLVFTVSNVFQLITNYHLYNPSSRPNDWNARINGNSFRSVATNLVSFPTFTPTLGFGQNQFDGDFVEVLIFNTVLDSGQRTTATEYLRRKFNLW